VQLSVRGKNRREKLTGLFSSIKNSTDGMLLNTTQKDIDTFFEQERVYLNDYFNNVKNATVASDHMTKSHKAVADSYIKLSSGLVQMANSAEVIPTPDLAKVYLRIGDSLEKLRKTENRVASDEDLKLSDLFRYYMRDTSAAKVNGVIFEFIFLIDSLLCRNYSIVACAVWPTMRMRIEPLRRPEQRIATLPRRRMPKRKRAKSLKTSQSSPSKVCLQIGKSF
jgi:hypothetical protein